MRALVVYESVFGDTAAVARAVARGLDPRMPAEALPATAAPDRLGADVGLLVVGAPNHSLGMPRHATRETALAQPGAQVADLTRGLREWLESVVVDVPGLPAAAFDTRLEHPWVLRRLDHAARTEEQLLTRLGCWLVAPAERFLVADATGPLAEGQEERAAAWGTALGERVGVRPGS